MPQMAPLSWLTLMLFFIIVFMIFNAMIFFNFNYNVNPTKKFFKKIKYNWKW